MQTRTAFQSALAALAVAGQLAGQTTPSGVGPRLVPRFSDVLTPRLTSSASKPVSHLGSEPDGQSESEPNLFKATLAPAALITLGLFTFKDDGVLSRQSVRDWRNRFVPDFDDQSEGLGQVLAGALALGLNVAGVPGRHGLFRATSTYAASMALESGMVFAMKGLTEVRRPDGSARNSFPSGHSAAAFASARFLDREYGHVSHLYSVTGYGIAAYTGIMRTLNDRHWISDVLVGAGIGILSTDLAYIAMDALFHEKGLNPPRPPKQQGPHERPSFVDLRIGYASYQGDLSERSDLVAEDGWIAGGEGAYFFNRYLGVGGDVSVTAFPINADNVVPTDPDLALVSDEINTRPIGTKSLLVGPFVSIPVAERWSVTGKATFGWAASATATVSARIKPEFQDAFGTGDVPILVLDPKPTVGAMAGIAVRGRVSERIGLRIFADYYLSKPDYQVRTADVDEAGNVVPGLLVDLLDVDFSYLAVGGGISVIVW